MGRRSAGISLCCTLLGLGLACAGTPASEVGDAGEASSSDDTSTATEDTEDTEETETETEPETETEGTEGEPTPYDDHTSELYEDLANWLCHAEIVDDACAVNLDTTEVDEQATTTVIPHVPAVDPPVDCFFVYPTVSLDPGGNSDLIAGEEETFTILNQAARYNQVCRVFAPLYRQITISALFNPNLEFDRELAYADVLDAFKTYVATQQQGRGVILIGHSQGASHLRRLVAEEVEAHPYLQERLIAAHLLGTTISVPEGARVGGDFSMTPACETPDQAGCVVSYASFRATEPPDPQTALFGTSEAPGQIALCTNPAALAGGSAPLAGYSPVAYAGALAAVIGEPLGPFADPDAHPPLTTPFFSTPGLVSAACVRDEELSYLEVTIHADPEDPRVDDIGGDFNEGWGLHLADMSLAMGDLVTLAASQSQAWLAGR